VTERSTKTENSTAQEAVRTAARLSRLYLDSLRAADSAGAYRVAANALAEGMTIPRLYQQVITPAMHEIGALWEKGALTVADEHLATALTHRVLAALRPPIRVEVEGGSEMPSGRGRVMFAAVEGEQHALGLRMAADVVEEAGFEAIYLGADVPTDALVQAIDTLSPDRLVLAATMQELTPRLAEVAATVQRVHPRVDLLIGGQAASPDLHVGTRVEDLDGLLEDLASR
jgi:MerR family transcriptional regulator, light-induced transcriptional regulator